MDIIFLIAFAVSFVITLIATPIWIRRAAKAGLMGKDIHKPGDVKVSEIGGLPVLIGFVYGLLSYVAIKTFVYHQTSINSLLLATLATVLLVAIIGLIDDILGWKIGLKQWQKPFFTFFAALPLTVINAGNSTISIPFIGQLHLGMAYPLLVIPLIITIFANGFNMLAGYNGLEASQGILILGTLGLIVWRTQNLGTIAMIAGCAMLALLAFLVYNIYPSKVFPGDTLTYAIGSIIAIVAILGNAEKIAVLLFIPYILEFFLKARGKFKKESFSKIDNNANLLPHSKVYGLEHIAVNILVKLKKPREPYVVVLINLFQAVLCIVVIVAYL